MHGDSYPSVPSLAAFADTIIEDMNADPCTSWLGSANHEAQWEVRLYQWFFAFFFDTI